MRVINIINLKGGVGKTFTSAQMAYLLSQKHNAKVLMVDNDKQGNLSKLFGAYDRDNTCPTALMLKGAAQASDVLKPTDYKDLDIISANMSLDMEAAQLLVNQPPDRCERYRSLKTAVNKDGQPYDYVIIDNPPDVGLDVINALSVANDVIVPVKIDQWALEGMEVITDQIETIKCLNPDINFIGALITMYKNNDTNTTGIDWLKTDQVNMFQTCIRYSDRAPQSTFTQLPIELYSPRSAAALSYRRMVKEYLNKVGG